MHDHDVLHHRDVTAPVAAMKAALAHARLFAPREVRFTDGGIVAVDVLGVGHALTRTGADAPVPLADVRDALGSHRLRSFSRSRDEESERDFGEEGTWVLGKGDDGTVSLKPKKPFPTCLEQLVDADPEALARLRSAYRLADVTVDVACEGESRARDLAATIAAERAMVGCPTSLSMPLTAEHRNRRSYGAIPAPLAPFDAMPGGGPWSVALIDPPVNHGYGSPAPVQANVKVREDRNAGYMAGRLQDAADRVEGRVAFVRVYLEKSRPVAAIAFSPTLAAELGTAPGFGNTPWDLHADRQAARSGRIRPPRTWHQTTEAVAEAFVARKAPRGFVSGDSLWFHGPIAFSVYASNPVAAIVDAPDGVPTILLGRNANIDGGTAAVVSMAQNDVVQAAGKAFRIIDIECLSGLVTLGDKPVDALARSFKHRKDEADYPAGCGFDAKGVAAWLAKAWERSEAEVEAAHGTSFPTYRQAQSIQRQVHLVERRDMLVSAFGLDLPDMGDVGPLRDRATAAGAAADERQRELDRRRRDRDAAAVGDGIDEDDDAEISGPGM